MTSAPSKSKSSYPHPPPSSSHRSSQAKNRQAAPDSHNAWTDERGPVNGTATPRRHSGCERLSQTFVTVVGVPRLSSFYGIVITMYFDDHAPPHFHARYAEHEAQISI